MPRIMKPSTILFTILLCLHLSPLTLLSQDSLQYRKLYLHTDREHYFQGDTLWYKAYYLDAKSNQFIPGIISMYAHLIDEMGDSHSEQVVALDNGTSAGALQIPADLAPGYYIIRAFTDLQKQVGEEAFFHKQIRISQLESFVEEASLTEASLPEEVYLDFMPEGGMLLEGIKNKVALKITDIQGNGVPVEGEILDSHGNSVLRFQSTYKGMGSFELIPEKGESYRARTAINPGNYHPLGEAVREGIKIALESEDPDCLHFRVVNNSPAFIGRAYYFAISHHGDVIYYKKFLVKKNEFPVTVNKDALPAGINRMVLMDEQLLPISERLYFSSNYHINEIKIKPDRRSYQTRSQVSLKLSEGKDRGEDAWSNLSMVVVDEFATGNENPSLNILSWLLIKSELRGFIESPRDYFTDDRKMSSNDKLDLLMLTQGWSRYVWNKPEAHLAFNAKDKEGFSLSGEVHRVLGKKPVSDGSLELKIYNNNFMHMDELELDQAGRFEFSDVSFMDSAAVFIQARNKRDKLSYQVRLDPIFDPFPGISAGYLPEGKTTDYKRAELYQRQYENLRALKEYTLKSGGFYIEEVTITEHRREPDDGHFRIYAKPSNSLQVTERDISYLNVFDYMQGRFSGVTVSKDGKISIRGPSGFTAREPLFVLDGFPVGKEAFLSLPMNDIDRVEVLKNPSETAMFGTRGGAGVVAVFTKKGGVADYSNQYIPGTIAEKLAGYAPYREFYTPRYTKENIQSERPDHRLVQYWDPNIFTENGKATVSFFSSDDISRFRIYVEGINSEGRICLGTASFEVNKRNDQLSAR